MSLCEEAEAFRLLLLMGVIDPSEVIAWADCIILAEEKVPEWLLEVTLRPALMLRHSNQSWIWIPVCLELLSLS